MEFPSRKFVGLQDLLRIRYPQATEDDINEMDLVARELTGETIVSASGIIADLQFLR